ncbi:unnamed protein product [Aureobasidium uvarum]|uniref:Uncharacterized protein n=1 Tax=Aureobasidium uvarum TaxID=2773716 RepID=A0A9N8PN43_9PEZI|nr:unnamed protein product [Aureobasidium uvarum]
MNPTTTKPTYLNYRAALNTTGLPSGIRTGSPASSTSAPMLNRLPSANSSIPTNPTGNSIILYVPNVASPSLSQHLSVLLSTHRVAAVHLIGRRDVVLKNLRTELYTLAGKMRTDVQVSISLTEGAKGLETAVRDIGARRQKVLGALVCEWDELPEEEEQEKDILTIDTDEIEAMWKVSVLPLHALLRNLLPLFADTTAETQPHPSAMPFIYLDTSSHLSTFAATSRSALLSSLTSSPATKNITIGPASEYLVPAPVVSETQSMRSLQIDTSNGGSSRANGYTSGSPETSPLFGAESPTKLWASWAAQYE